MKTTSANFLLILSAIAVIFTSALLLPSPKSHIPNPDSLPPSSATLTWQTYQNDQYGFSFQYPSEYDLYDSPLPEQSDLYSRPIKHLSIFDIDNNILFSLEIFANKLASVDRYYQDLSNKCSLSNITCNTEQWFPYNTKGQLLPNTTLEASKFGLTIAGVTQYGNYYGFYHRGHIYQIFLNNVLSSEQKNHILSSINTFYDSSSWKIYEDKKLGFTFQYPTKYKNHLGSLWNKDNSQAYNLYIDKNPQKLDLLNYELANIKNNIDNPPESGNGYISLFVDNGEISPTVETHHLPNIGDIYFRKNAPSIVDIDEAIWFYKDLVFRFSTYSENSNLIEFFQILSTFKFTDATSDWKTYKNKELGYQFDYPSDSKFYPCTIDEVCNGDGIYTKNYYIGFVYKYKKSNQSFDDWFDSYSKETFNQSWILKQERITFNNYPAIKLTHQPPENTASQIYYFVYNGQSVIEIKVEDINLSNNQTISQILSTFKFTN